MDPVDNNSSLYSKYLKERTGKQIFETDMGFAVYSYENDYVYLEDVYVDVRFRKAGISRHMVNLIAAEALSKGIKKMLTTCSPAANGSTDSLKTILAQDFKLLTSDSNLIYFIKELGA